jgi:hypothetical protein
VYRRRESIPFSVGRGSARAGVDAGAVGRGSARAGVDAGAVGRGSARAGASRLASPPRMNQTETLRIRLAAAMVTADKQIGPGPSFSKRSRGARLVSGHTKACYESDRGGSFVGSSVLVEAAGKPRLGRSLALPRLNRARFDADRKLQVSVQEGRLQTGAQPSKHQYRPLRNGVSC